MKPLAYLLLALWLIVSYNSDFLDTPMPVIGFGINTCLEGSLLLLTLPSVFKRKKNVYQIWCLMMLAFWAYTTTYSVNQESFKAYWQLSLTYLLTFTLSSHISTLKDIEKLIGVEFIAVALCGVYVLLFVNTSSLDSIRLGGDTAAWNANDIGLKMVIGYAISIYCLMKGMRGKFLYWGLICLFVLVCLMSGSRKVIIFLTLFTALLMIIKSRGRKKILYSIYAMVFTTFVYYAVMNIPALYGIVGHRIEMMIEGLFGGNGGYSMKERTMMIIYGLEWFEEKPLLGHGYVGFSTMFEDATGWYTYSHNNFIELMVNTGLIGLVLYYSITIYIIVNLWKPALREYNLFAIFLFIYTIISTLIDYAMVSYVSIPSIYRIMYTTLFCSIYKKQSSYHSEQNLPQVQFQRNEEQNNHY